MCEYLISPTIYMCVSCPTFSSFRIGFVPLLRACSLITIWTYFDPPLNARTGMGYPDLKCYRPESLPAHQPPMDYGGVGARLDVPRSSLWDCLHGASTHATSDLHCTFY